MNASREQWGSRHGFILATIGGAVGIGNIWRFSYVAGENGGAVFLIIYLSFVLLIGLPLMIAELSVGRQAQGDAVAGFENDRKSSFWPMAGWLGIAAAFLLLTYYSVIAGWVLKYFVGATTGALWEAAGAGFGGYFSRFIANQGEPLAWQLAAVAIAISIVAGGVQRGIELANRVLIPVLAIIVISLAAYALNLSGASDGVKFLFVPDWSAFSEPGVYLAALGQAFFSLGVGMAVFVTYGGYMPRTFSIPVSAGLIAAGDTLFAIIAGLAIFPAIFALGGEPAAGPELAFIVLPQIFLKMPAGALIGVIFFFLLAAAAVTSMVALLEVPVASLIHRFGVRRWLASACIGTIVFLLGLPSALSYGALSHIKIGTHGLLDAIDFGVSNFLFPTVGFLTALYVGWHLKRDYALFEADLFGHRIGTLWLWLLRVLVPITIVGILLNSAAAL